MRVQPITDASIKVQLLVPSVQQPGRPFTLRYQLSEVRMGAPLTDVVASHERLIHLIVVRQDLRHFQHLHPEPTDVPGEFALALTFPESGRYLLFIEFARASGEHISQKDVLTVGSPSSEMVALVEDWGPQTIGDIRVSLRGAKTIQAGQEIALSFHLEDVRTGEGLRNLRPYLGAPAHVVILSENGEIFGHTHGELPGAAGEHHIVASTRGGHVGHEMNDAPLGPEINFRHTFPTPGLYKLWGQFQTDAEQVITASFTVRIH
jgi:Cu+-exporting ATPase